MALTKRTYVDGETKITADNLNAIQDEIIANETKISNVEQTATDAYESAGAAYELAEGKQPLLVSGTNIKTINGQSVLGSGDFSIATGVSGASVFTNNVAVSGSTATIDVQDLDAASHSQARTQPMAGDLVYVVTDGVAYFYTISGISGTTATLEQMCQLTGEGGGITEEDKQEIVDEVLANLPVYNGEVLD